MPTFRLVKGSDRYDFETTGAVKKNDVAFGRWAVGADNRCQLVAEGPGGAREAFDVEWRFDADNHLCVHQPGGAKVFDFHAPGARPVYTARDAVLVVRPHQADGFSFALRGEWDLSAEHDLSITVNQVKSVIDGFIFDRRSRFMYHFFDKRDLTREFVLGFVGEWSQFVDDADGKPKMNFRYKREDGSIDTFRLPNAIAIERTLNQFVYEYSKQNRTSRVQFVGLLVVNSNLEITYTIDRQVSGGGEQQTAATTFTIGAVFHKKNFEGDVELLVKKQDGGAGATTLAIRGSFTAVLGRTNLQVGFTFSQTRGADTVVTTFGFEGRLDFGETGAVVWRFARDATTTTISIAATDIVIGQARLDARLNIQTANGEVIGVRALLGVAF